MNSIIKYPVGIQTFQKIREEGYLYVDKTMYLHAMVSSGQTMFLSRPRRFGKSLFISTLQAYFEGKKELFEGLYISKFEEKWEHYPVLRFDMSEASVNLPGQLEAFLKRRILEYTKQYGLEEYTYEEGTGTVFGRLIRDISLVTHKQVVVLIDEYDKGLLDSLDNKELFDEHCNLLQPFFQQLKSQDEYLRMSFITGVSRFRHVTLFSGVNNLEDLSMNPHYAGICGITQKELEEDFKSGICELSKSQKWTESETLEKLKSQYDGYRFSNNDTLVYNPFSLMNVFKNRMFKNYWAMSGISESLLSFIKERRISIADMTSKWYSEEELSKLFNKYDAASLFFQTGYLTVADTDDGDYMLCIPNEEVNQTLVKVLLPYYTSTPESDVNGILKTIKREIEKGNADAFMKELQSLMGKIPYHIIDYAQLEKHFHSLVYLVFMMLDLDTEAEISISGGRIDLMCYTDTLIYLFEFKIDGSAKEALDQINNKGYCIPWKADGRKIIKIGAVFSSKTKTLIDWLIE